MFANLVPNRCFLTKMCQLWSPRSITLTFRQKLCCASLRTFCWSLSNQSICAPPSSVTIRSEGGRPVTKTKGAINSPSLRLHRRQETCQALSTQNTENNPCAENAVLTSSNHWGNTLGRSKDPTKKWNIRDEHLVFRVPIPQAFFMLWTNSARLSFSKIFSPHSGVTSVDGRSVWDAGRHGGRPLPPLSKQANNVYEWFWW